MLTEIAAGGSGTGAAGVCGAIRESGMALWTIVCGGVAVNGLWRLSRQFSADLLILEWESLLRVG